MTVPAHPHTHVCVICHLAGVTRDATTITPARGYAVCDTHAVLSETAIRQQLTTYTPHMP